MVFVKIDENGDPVTGPILQENLEYILETKDITDELLAENNYARVKDWLYPEGLTDEQEAIATDDLVKNPDGTISRGWNIVTLSVAEKVRRWVLGPREQKLFRTDWTQMNDSPLSAEDKALWKEYRAKLRSLTDDVDLSTIASAEDIPWPVPPAPIEATEVGGKWDKVAEETPTPVTTAEPDDPAA